MEDILKSLDVIMEDLTPEQIEGLKKISEKIANPANMTASEAMKIVKDLNLDMEKLQKNANKIKNEMRALNKKPRVGANEQCPCGSGKKYKKCCKL